MKSFTPVSITLTLALAISQSLSAMQENNGTTIVVEPVEKDSVHASPQELRRMSEVVGQQVQAQEQSASSSAQAVEDDLHNKTCLSRLNRALNHLSHLSHKYKINYLIAAFDAALCTILVYDLIDNQNTAPQMLWLSSAVATLHGGMYEALEVTIKKLQKRADPDQQQQIAADQSMPWYKKLQARCKNIPQFCRNHIGAIFTGFVMVNSAKDLWEISNGGQTNYGKLEKTLDSMDIIQVFGAAGLAAGNHVKTRVKERLEELDRIQRERRGSGAQVELDTLGESRKTTQLDDSTDDDSSGNSTPTKNTSAKTTPTKTPELMAAQRASLDAELPTLETLEKTLTEQDIETTLDSIDYV